MKLVKVIPFITTAIIMCAIFAFSSQSSTQSSEVSQGLTAKIVDMIPIIKDKPPHIKAEIVKDIHNAVRKCAHFVLYALLGCSSFLMFAALREGKGSFEQWIFAMVFCVLYAISDEVHQFFIPGRSGEVGDVLLDLSGAMSGGTVIVNLKDTVFCRNDRG